MMTMVVAVMVMMRMRMRMIKVMRCPWVAREGKSMEERICLESQRK